LKMSQNSFVDTSQNLINDSIQDFDPQENFNYSFEQPVTTESQPKGVLGRNYVGSSKFFAKNALSNIQRHKCNFGLAFCATFIVVLSSLVVNSLIDQGPVVFLKLAEQSSGEADAFVTNIDYYMQTFYWTTTGWY
jgi:hypothetical protein